MAIYSYQQARNSTTGCAFRPDIVEFTACHVVRMIYLNIFMLPKSSMNGAVSRASLPPRLAVLEIGRGARPKLLWLSSSLCIALERCSLIASQPRLRFDSGRCSAWGCDGQCTQPSLASVFQLATARTRSPPRTLTFASDKYPLKPCHVLSNSSAPVRNHQPLSSCSEVRCAI